MHLFTLYVVEKVTLIYSFVYGDCMDVPDEVTSHARMPICLSLYIDCSVASIINNLYTWKSIDLEHDYVLHERKLKYYENW
jgi:hypothetical protein